MRMRTIALPYGHESLELHVDEDHLKAVVETDMDGLVPDPGEADLVYQALESPIGTPRLSELAQDKRRIVIVTSDHTRAVPSRITLPILLAEIRSSNPDADITILIATGLHRVTTEEEQRRMFGNRIVDEEHIVCNDAFDSAQFVDMGTLPSGERFFCLSALRCCQSATSTSGTITIS